MLLRLAAVFGTLALIGFRAEESFPLPERAWTALVLLLAFLFLITLLLATSLRREFRVLLHNLDLLVPLLYYLPIAAGVLWLSGRPGMEWFVEPFWSFEVGRVDVAISGLLAVLVLMIVVLYAWVTPMVWSAVRSEGADAGRALRGLPRAFLPACVAGLFGSVGMLLLLVPLAEAAKDLIDGDHEFAGISLLFVVGTAFNVLTAALLAGVLSGDRPFHRAFLSGLAAGVKGFPRWWLPFLAQALLLGAAYVVPYDYEDVRTTRETTGSTTTTSRTVTHREGVQYGSNIAWTGGYPDDTAWENEVAKDWGTQRLSIASLLLTMLLATLAVVLKLRICSRYGDRDLLGEDGVPAGSLQDP